jgi:hypothetical protein
VDPLLVSTLANTGFIGAKMLNTTHHDLGKSLARLRRTQDARR